MKKSLFLVLFASTAAFAGDFNSAPFMAQGDAVVTIRSCWVAGFPCETAENRMRANARASCGDRARTEQLSPTETDGDLEVLRSGQGCTFYCTARAQFRCIQ